MADQRSEPILTTDQIAHVVHETNRAVQLVTGDPAPSPTWSEAPDWERTSAAESVKAVIDGVTPEELHDRWVASKVTAGWTLGPVKDAALRTHPCLVPYDALPAEQQLKDQVMTAVVCALAGTS